jgi:hypothetical protein
MSTGGSYLTMRQKCLMCMYKAVLVHSERIFPDFFGRVNNHIGDSIFRVLCNITLMASRLLFLKFGKIQMSSSFVFQSNSCTIHTLKHAYFNI